MKTYKLQKHGPLLVVKTCVIGPEGMSYPNLLLDTGSAYTILSQEILYSIGFNPAEAKKTLRRIITGSGYEIVPVISVHQFYCFGQRVANFDLLAYTLPSGIYVDGLLGMDFLNRFDIDLSISTGKVFIK
jgi:predicted aspartyl protease